MACAEAGDRPLADLVDRVSQRLGSGPHLDFNAVYRWKDGKLARVTTDMPAVNGLAFSPDEKYLYVNGSRDNYVNRYDVRADGWSLDDKRQPLLPDAKLGPTPTTALTEPEAAKNDSGALKYAQEASAGDGDFTFRRLHQIDAAFIPRDRYTIVRKFFGDVVTADQVTATLKKKTP